MSGTDPKASDAKVLSTEPLVWLGVCAGSDFANPHPKPDDQGCSLDKASFVSLLALGLAILTKYFRRTTYKDPLGKQRTWESAERSVCESF